MAEMQKAARRGRRENTLDEEQPAHLRAFAGKLRALRTECGQPPYRRLSELAHCSFASLSAAAAGRRFPSWETTRGYVTGCLRHAGRTAEIGTRLPQWRREWEATAVRDKALRIEPTPAPAPQPPAEVRRAPRWGPVAAVLALLATMTGAVARPLAPPPMDGLYNILVVPFESFPAAAGGLERALVRDLGEWARDEPVIQTRGPGGVDRVTGVSGRARDQALTRLATDHHADVVLSGRLRPAGADWTVIIEVVVTERVFAETPEFVGRHELTLTEPADVIRGNVELNRQFADHAVRYLRAVLAFVRGLGRYALDDYPGAESDFRTASTALEALGPAGPAVTPSSEVVLLMLGNTVGRAGRHVEAAGIFRRALHMRPGYSRATVGLAEALRAGGCTRARRAALEQALQLYATALSGADSPLLEMKTRLGLGLTHQCLSIAGSPAWAEADDEFAAVLRIQAAAGLTGEAGRQSLRLAAEARAGQALTAWHARRLTDAAVGYEDALRRLDSVGVTRATITARELVFLRNLRDVYGEMHAPDQAAAVQQRILQAGGQR